MVAASARRAQAKYAMGKGLSQRRACQLCQVARSTLKYRSRLDEKDRPITEAMLRLSAQYPRYGYRRIRIFLQRDGFDLSEERAYRIWSKAGLQVPKKRRRRRATAARPRPLAPARSNQVWAYDFVYDRCANGRALKCLTVVDEHTRECLSIRVSGRIRSADVIDELTRLISLHGAPKHLRSDNGPEFVSKAIIRWLVETGIETAHIDPGKPWQNGVDESFNGKFRDECLNQEWFTNRRTAAVIIESWRQHYNAVRPHSSLDYRTPLEYKQASMRGDKVGSAGAATVHGRLLELHPTGSAAGEIATRRQP